jgi:hypothetical protein
MLIANVSGEVYYKFNGQKGEDEFDFTFHLKNNEGLAEALKLAEAKLKKENNYEKMFDPNEGVTDASHTKVKAKSEFTGYRVTYYKELYNTDN